MFRIQWDSEFYDFDIWAKISQHKINSVLYVEFKFGLEFPKQSFHALDQQMEKQVLEKEKDNFVLFSIYTYFIIYSWNAASLRNFQCVCFVFFPGIWFAFHVPCFFIRFSKCSTTLRDTFDKLNIKSFLNKLWNSVQWEMGMIALLFPVFN